MISGTGTSHANSTPGQKKKSRIDLKILENLGAMDNTLVVRLLGHSSRIFHSVPEGKILNDFRILKTQY